MVVCQANPGGAVVGGGDVAGGMIGMQPMTTEAYATERMSTLHISWGQFAH